MTRKTTALAWGLCIVGCVSMVAGYVLARVIGHAGQDGVIEGLGLLVGFASFPVLGALIASRQPQNPLGWIFVSIGITVGILLVSTEYSWLAFVKNPGIWPGATIAAWLQAWLWFPGLMAIPTLCLLLFPTGRSPSPRWRWLTWASAGLIFIVCLATMLQGKLDIEGHAIDNPIGILPFADGEEAIQPAFLAFFPLMLLSASSLVARFRKAKAEERQQLKLLIWGASIFVVTTILGDRLDLPEVLFPLTLWMIPAAIAVAILKYRLYDIDAIINRTLVYALLTALLGLIYFGIVVILQQVLSPVTQQSDLAIAGSTLAVAALFRPMRSRVQEFIDRRFYRRRYDATETLETFSARLRDRVDLPSLTDDLVTVVATTMEPAHASIWLRKPSIE